MIGYLRGRVIEQGDGRALVGVGNEDSVVGYAVAIPSGAAYDSLLPGRAAEFFIYTHVREDSLDLYGFLSKTEKELFLTLLSVNGIGPKLAMGILSKVDSATLISAIMTGDKDSLTKIPGIGKKTAERVVLELGDTVRKKVEAGTLAHPRGGLGATSGRATVSVTTGASGMIRDAKDALLGLGYREHEIAAALARVVEEKSPKRVEDLIRIALQQLG